MREALAALQSEGLVRLHPQRGAVVFVPTVEGLREHYEIRAALEALAAERAAERFDPARGEQLAAMLDEMAAGPGVERYLELNLRFDSELYELAGRPRLVDMIETLRDASSAYLHIYAKVDFPSERLDAEHREILAACQEGEREARGPAPSATTCARRSSTSRGGLSPMRADAVAGTATGARATLAQLADELVEHDAGLVSTDPLEWPGYDAQLARTRALGELESVVSAEGRVGDPRGARRVRLRLHGRLDERGRRAEDRQRLPPRRRCRPACRLAADSSGGCRMQEGMKALVQMQRIAAANQVLAAAGVPHVAILMGPTTGGAWASIAAGADVVLAVPEATAAFAGHRVREGGAKATIQDTVASGQVDLVVPREELALTLATLLGLLVPDRADLPPADVPTALGASDLPSDGWDAVQRGRARSDAHRSRAQAYLDEYFDVRVGLAGDRRRRERPGDAVRLRPPRRRADRLRERRRAAANTPAGFRKPRRASCAWPTGSASRSSTLIDTPGAANDDAAEGAAIGPAHRRRVRRHRRRPRAGHEPRDRRGRIGRRALRWRRTPSLWIAPDGYFAVIGPESAAAILKLTAGGFRIGSPSGCGCARRTSSRSAWSRASPRA